jgi:hypothetical protein
MGLNVWNVDWYLDPETCPCDVHLLEYLGAEGIKGARIFHFGTGGHHVVGIRCAEDGSNNAVLGITASPPEYQAYVKLISERPEVGRSYKAFFGDIYQLDARLLPELDVLSLFHVGEFRTEKNDAYGALTDLEMVSLLVDKLRPGGLVLFYEKSYAFDVAERVATALTKAGRIEPHGSFKTLRIFRKRG